MKTLNFFQLCVTAYSVSCSNQRLVESVNIVEGIRGSVNWPIKVQFIPIRQVSDLEFHNYA